MIREKSFVLASKIPLRGPARILCLYEVTLVKHDQTFVFQLRRVLKHTHAPARAHTYTRTHQPWLYTTVVFSKLPPASIFME